VARSQYVKLEYSFIYSDARKSLSLAARELYLQIRARRNIKGPRGNIINKTDDFIRFSFGDSNGMSKPTYQRAIKELVEKGFVGVMDPGGVPNRKAAYAIIHDWNHLNALED